MNDVLEHLLQTGSMTNTSPVDQLRATMLLREARRTDDYEEALAIVMQRRNEWREWVFTTQRSWQRETRRKSRARDRDSISTREYYVRALKNPTTQTDN